MTEITAVATYTTAGGQQRDVTVRREHPNEGDATEFVGDVVDMAASLLPSTATLHSVDVTIDHSSP